jgi:predicted Zn-dependent peptidase
MPNAKNTNTLLVKITFLIFCFMRAKIIKTCSFEKDIFVLMKYCTQIVVLVLLIISPFVKIKAQASTDLYRVVKSSNGQSFLLNTTANGSSIFTDIYFRIGPIYEFDSLSGISSVLSKVINTHIAAAIKADNKQITYSGTVESEQIAFHFESSRTDLTYVLNLANDKIMHAKFDAEGLAKAKVDISTGIDSLTSGESYKINTKILKTVWGNDFKKLNPNGDLQTYNRITLEDLKAFHTRYLLPFNNTVSIVGNFSDKEVLDKLLDIFKDFKSREFNPELITKVIDFKPIVNTIQMISGTTDSQNTATITYQNPGARQDRDATYAAFILTQLINDKNGRIQKSMKDAGFKTLRAIYTCNNFYGTFTLSATLSGSNFADAFMRLNQLVTDITQKDYFKEGELEVAKKNIGIEYNDLKAKNLREYMMLVMRYRFSNDENYFTSFPDSINGVSTEHMRSYVNDYFTDHAAVRNLITSDDSLKGAASVQQYFPLDQSISDVVFRYELNKTDIETDEAKQNIKQVIQWLRINTDIHIQVNGFADEGEFTKSYDDSVMKFIDSTATFHKAMPDATKKGYLRIEFMRAMKIAKALYEAGITEDRISGTSMVFTSDTREAAAANRKCTLTFEKIKPHLSLYEYHFGKKKDEPQQN